MTLLCSSIRFGCLVKLPVEGAVEVAGEAASLRGLYFVLHRHGLNMCGRWVGLGYDDKIMTGWGSMAKTAEEAEAVIKRLNQASGQVART